jgi:hypothetical protein
MKRKIGKKARASRVASRKLCAIHKDAAGRTHLALHHGPGGQEFVALRAPIFEEAWQNEIASVAANTAHANFAAEPSVARAVELARSVMASTSRIADALLSKAPAGSVACKAGCDHCCYQAVGVTAPEALAIFAHLTTTLSASEFERMAARVEQAHQRTLGSSPADRFSPEHPCIFLESGRCSIYEVRPLSCRGMNSLDAAECRTRLHDVAARSAFVATGVGSSCYMEPIRAFHAVSAGLQLALAELHGLDMRPLDLTRAMRLLFTRGATVGGEWVRGEASFEPACGADVTDADGVGSIVGFSDGTLGPSHHRLG